jgi:hypothetical protein
VISPLRAYGAQLVQRFPLLQRLSSLGIKYVVIEALIELPFLLIELSLWFGPLFGLTFGLSLWQRVLLVMLLYALVEGSRFVFVVVIRRRPYRFLSAEWEVLKAVVQWVMRAIRRVSGTGPTRSTNTNTLSDHSG